MPKLAISGLVLALLAVVVVGWLRHDGGGGARDLVQVSAPTSAAERVRDVPAPPAPAERAVQSIAGKVVFAGLPVAGAAVELHVAAQPELAVASAFAASDGTFAFRIQLATSYTVTASAFGYSPAIATVELNNPRSHPGALVLTLGDCTWRSVGIVADADGVRIPYASVRIDAVVGVETDANGHYELCRPPGSSLITVAASGYGRVVAELAFRGTIRRDFTLAPEAVLFGRVTRKGTAVSVAGVKITAVPADNPTSHMSEARVMPASAAQSASNGGFQIGGLTSGRFRIEATTPELGSEIVDIYLESGVSKELEIVVDARARVHGRVTAHGMPVSGAWVTASEPHHLGGAAGAWSQADGGFVVDGAPSGLVTWNVRGYDVVPRPAMAIGGADVTDVVIEVTAGAAIRGRVTAAGAAVADADISCNRADWTHGFGLIVHTARSDLDGNYTIDDAAPGECTLEARSESLGVLSDPQSLVVAGGAVTTADVDLAIDGSLSGVVVDQLGAPVATAYVLLEADDDRREAMTDDAGTFTIHGLHATDYKPVVSPSPIDAAVFSTPDGVERAMIHVPGPHAVISGVRFVVRSDRAMIRGKVIDELGLPVSYARVQIESGILPPDVAAERRKIVVKTMPPWFRPNLGILAATPSTTTDSAGRFQLGDLVTGSYDVRARAADGGSAVAYRVGTDGVEATITLPHAGDMEGTLVGFGNAPTVSVTDHRYNPQSTIAAGNHFSFRGLSPGTYSVVATDGTGADARVVEVRPGIVARVALNSRGTGRVEGRVVDSDGGAPVPGVRCLAAPAAGGFAQWWSSEVATLSGADGRFTLDPVPAGSVHVECLGTGWARSQREAAVASDGNVTVVELAMVRWQEPSSNLGFRMLNEQLPPTVAFVDPGGPAGIAGLVVGDQIVAIDGTTVARIGVGGLGALLVRHPSGMPTRLSVVRAATRLDITLVKP